IGLAVIDRAAKSLRTRDSDDDRRLAATCWDGADAAPPSVLGHGPHERRRIERRVDDTGRGPDHSLPRARDIPGKTHARREVFAIGLPQSIAYAWLALLNQSQRRIEVTQEAADLFYWRCVFVAQSQIEHQFRGDAPVILNELRGLLPGHRAD